MIEKQGDKWVLKSKMTGQVLGKHETRAEAIKQEQAINIRRHRAKGGNKK